jgi:hypothetical protein
MNPTRTALVLSSLAAGLWAVKSVAIGLSGGLGRSPFEGPLFLAGLVCAVVGAVTLGVAVSRGRGLLSRIATAVGVLVVLAAVCLLGQALIGGVEPANPGWVWSELNLWLTAALLVAASVAHARRVSGPATRGRSSAATVVSDSR